MKIGVIEKKRRLSAFVLFGIIGQHSTYISFSRVFLSGLRGMGRGTKPYENKKFIAFQTLGPITFYEMSRSYKRSMGNPVFF